MDILHCDLEAVEKFGFGVLYFSHKVFGKVFIYNPIRSGKKGKNVRDEMSFSIVQVFPVGKILA